MATVHWIVDTASGNWPEYVAVYSGLEAAMGDAYDLVTADESIVIDCVDSSNGANHDTTAVTVDGWTTDATHTLTVQAHKSQRHGGIWNDGYYLINAGTYTDSIYISDTNLTLDGVQVLHSNGNNGDNAIYSGYLGASYTLNVLNCSLKYQGDYPVYGININTSSNSGDTPTVAINNNIVNGNANLGYSIRVGRGTFDVSNNIVYNCDSDGITSTADTVGTIEHNIVLNSTGSDFNIVGGSSDYNVSSDTTAPGTNTVQSFDHSTLFPNAATGDFRPAISYVSALGTTWGAGAIPWERSVVVNTDTGGDYSTLSAAEAGEQTIGDDLVLRNEKMVISCTSGGMTTADTTAVTIDANWTTSESCDFSVVGEANGVWDDSKYHLYGNVTTSTAIKLLLLNVQNITIDGLQLKLESTDSARGGNVCIYTSTNSNNSSIKNNLVVGTGTGGTYSDIIGIELQMPDSGGPYNYTYTNNIAIGFKRNNTSCYGFSLMAAAYRSMNLAFKNNLAIDCENGFRYGASGPSAVVDNLSVINNLSARNTVDFIADNSATFVTTLYSTNISSDGTAPDNSISYTVYDAAIDTLPVVPEDCVIFKDITNNDFRLVSHKISNVEQNAAIGNGTWLYDFDTDITGAIREVPWDIGAFKYVVDQGVILTSPADGVTDVAQPITFSWEAVTGATAYQLQIATDSNFSTLVHDDSTIVTTSVDVSGLADNTLHYWRVRADV